MTRAGRGFPRGVRLLRPAEFARVYARRTSAADGPLVVYAAPNDAADGRTRLGLSVSRRIGGAVERNRWKRTLREAFRAARGDLPAGTDVLVVVRSGSPPVGAAAAEALRAALVGLARRVVGRPGYASRGGDRPRR